jgi:hypothetical protein
MNPPTLKLLSYDRHRVAYTYNLRVFYEGRGDILFECSLPTSPPPRHNVGRPYCAGALTAGAASVTTAEATLHHRPPSAPVGVGGWGIGFTIVSSRGLLTIY